MGYSRIKITYQPDGKILAEYVPGDANLAYWVDRHIPLDTWKRPGPALTLHRIVTQAEADYLENLATNYHESPCPVIGRPPKEAFQGSMAAEANHCATRLDETIFRIEDTGQLCLF